MIGILLGALLVGFFIARACSNDDDDFDGFR